MMEMMENREGGGKGELLESQSMDLSLLFLGRRLLAARIIFRKRIHESRIRNSYDHMIFVEFNPVTYCVTK